LGNYRSPIDPSLCHFISGRADYFYGAEKMTNVENVWNGVKVTHLDVGHVDGFLREGKIYRQIIHDTLTSRKSENILFDITGQFEDIPLLQSEDSGDAGLDLIQKIFQKTTSSFVKALEK